MMQQVRTCLCFGAIRYERFLPLSFKIALLAPGESDMCPYGGEAILNDMGE